jgi:hypothetical protein
MDINEYLISHKYIHNELSKHSKSGDLGDPKFAAYAAACLNPPPPPPFPRVSLAMTIQLTAEGPVTGKSKYFSLYPWQKDPN